MDCKAWDNPYRTFKINQGGLECAFTVTPADPTGQGEFAVKPGTKQGTAIHFNPKLQVVVVFLDRIWL